MLGKVDLWPVDWSWLVNVVRSPRGPRRSNTPATATAMIICVHLISDIIVSTAIISSFLRVPWAGVALRIYGSHIGAWCGKLVVSWAADIILAVVKIFVGFSSSRRLLDFIKFAAKLLIWVIIVISQTILIDLFEAEICAIILGLLCRKGLRLYQSLIGLASIEGCIPPWTSFCWAQ